MLAYLILEAEKNGVGFAQLARILGMTKQTLYSYQSGKIPPVKIQKYLTLVTWIMGAYGFDKLRELIDE